MHDSETFQCSKIPITNAWCTENFLTLILHVKVLSSTQHKICHYGAVQDPVNFQSSTEETKSNTIIAHIHQKYKKNPITHNKHQVLSHITKWPNSYSPKTTRTQFSYSQVFLWTKLHWIHPTLLFTWYYSNSKQDTTKFLSPFCCKYSIFMGGWFGFHNLFKIM